MANPRGRLASLRALNCARHDNINAKAKGKTLLSKVKAMKAQSPRSKVQSQEQGIDLGL
jgi:hypothetical protein